MSRNFFLSQSSPRFVKPPRKRRPLNLETLEAREVPSTPSAPIPGGDAAHQGLQRRDQPAQILLRTVRQHLSRRQSRGRCRRHRRCQGRHPRRVGTRRHQSHLRLQPPARQQAGKGDAACVPFVYKARNYPLALRTVLGYSQIQLPSISRRTPKFSVTAFRKTRRRSPCPLQFGHSDTKPIHSGHA